MSYSSLLDRFPGLRVLVVGDLMLDEYIHGRATRISPEAPVMVVRQHSTSSVPGGAANVALNARALGAKADVVGVVGDDPAGANLGRHLGEGGLVREPGRVTTRKTRVLADHAHQVLRIDDEDDEGVRPETEAKILATAGTAMANASVLILSDYLKGALTHGVVSGLIAQAQKGGLPIVANPKPRSLHLYRGATLISLNRAEASEALGLAKSLSDDDAIDSAKRLQDQYGLETVLITLGEGGMAVGAGDGFRVSAPRVEVYDTAGAGDTVIATVALGLAASQGIDPTVFELAVQTAAAVVRKVGVSTVSPEDLDAIRLLG